MHGELPSLQVGLKPVDRSLADVVHRLPPRSPVAPLDLRHGLVVLTPLGVVIQLGVAERDIKGAVPHQLFDDLERGPRVEELGGKRMPQRVRGIGLRDRCKFQVPHPKSGGIWERQVPLSRPNDVSSQVRFTGLSWRKRVGAMGGGMEASLR